MKLLSYRETCDYFSVTRDGLRKIQLKNPDFPKPIKLGDTKQAPVYYILEEIEQWIELKKTERLGDAALLKSMFEATKSIMWNSAPEWANWWFVNSFGVAFWYEDKPSTIQIDNGKEVTFEATGGMSAEAPNFRYKGDWKLSLTSKQEIPN